MTDYNELSYDLKRKMNYPEMSSDDIGHLYDIITSILNALEENDITVTIGDNDIARLNFRNLIKQRIPKD